MTYTMKHTPLVAAMLLVLNSPLAQAVPGDKNGDEFTVNPIVTGNQFDSSIAIDADGDFVITWTSDDGQDGSGLGIFAQRYNADGIPVDIEVQVYSVTSGDQASPSVAMDADGDFVITWHSDDQNGLGIYAQRYNANGNEEGIEFQVNSHTDNIQSGPSIATDADGDFVITWASTGQDDPNDSNTSGIFAQRYNADGNKTGNEFQVNNHIAGAQSNPSIAIDAGGDFVIAWNSDGQDSNASGIYAQRYNANGSTADGEFQVNTTTTLAQQAPSIAMDADGDFVITWRSELNIGEVIGDFAIRSEERRVGKEC